MGLKTIFDHGINVMLEKHSHELESQLEKAEQALLKSILLKTPKLLVELDRVTYDESAPMVARAMFPAISSYLWNTDDVVPAREGQMLLGIIDDIYLVHRAAEVVSHQTSIDVDGFAEAFELFRKLLGEESIRKLDAVVDDAVHQVEEQARSLQQAGR